jgi:hypothetical protein
MQAIFPLVLFGSIALFVVVGVLSMLTRNNLYDQIGQGGLSIGEDQLGGGSFDALGARDPTGSNGSDELRFQAEREQEIRQMLQARSDRLVRRGQAPLDIDAELALLERPGPAGSGAGGNDAGLAEEVRQLVVARNERRARQGLETLDVESEVRRTLSELNP